MRSSSNSALAMAFVSGGALQQVVAQGVPGTTYLAPLPILAPTGNTLAGSVILGNNPATWTYGIKCMDSGCASNPAATATLGPNSYAFGYTSGVNTTAYTCPMTNSATVTCDVTIANAQGTQRAQVPYAMSDLTASILTNPTGQIVQNVTLTTGGYILPSSLAFVSPTDVPSTTSTPSSSSSSSSSSTSSSSSSSSSPVTSTPSSTSSASAGSVPSAASTAPATGTTTNVPVATGGNVNSGTTNSGAMPSTAASWLTLFTLSIMSTIAIL